MGGVKNPFGGGNIGGANDLSRIGVVSALPVLGGGGVLAGDAATGGAISKGIAGIDTSIKDPAGMQQYTDLANQAQQEYGRQRQFLTENVDPRRKQMLDALALQAQGQGPSIAQEQLKSAFDKSLQQQLAAARSQRGGNAGLAARNVSNAAAQNAQGLAQQSAVARMQEQMAGQQGLQKAIENEQSYATGTLGSALGSQANVATMQQGIRDRNDARNRGLFEGTIGAVGKAFGLPFAKGGQVARYAKGGKVKNKMGYAEGGSVSMDMNAAQSMLKSKQNAKPPKSFAEQLACGGQAKKMAKGGNPYEADTGDVSGFVKQTENTVKAEQDFFKRMSKPKNPGQESEEPAKLAKGGLKPGDHESNDIVPALLSPGEVVVPRSVVDKGPVAAAHFVKQASKNENYNADNFHQEKKTFAQMLKGLQESEEKYAKIKNIAKKVK